MHMRHLLASALVFVGAGGAVAQFEPRIVTEQTLVDSEALARLQRPGDVFFADDAESESGFDRFLEVGGRGTRATQGRLPCETVRRGDAVDDDVPQR